MHVKTRHGNVSLTGTVPSAGDKQRAEEAVQALSGVHSVSNRLKIVEPDSSE